MGAEAHPAAVPRDDADRTVLLERGELDLAHQFEAVLPERRRQVVIVELLGGQGPRVPLSRPWRGW